MKILTTLLFSLLLTCTTHACERCHDEACTDPKICFGRDLDKLIGTFCANSEKEILEMRNNSLSGASVDNTKELLAVIELQTHFAKHCKSDQAEITAIDGTIAKSDRK